MTTMDPYERRKSEDEEPAFSGIFSRTFLVVLVVGLVGVYLYRNYVTDRALLDPTAEPRIVTPRGDLAADERSMIALFEAAAPSVAHIQTERLERSFHEGLGITEGTGSGFVWDREGHVVTNYHVVHGVQSADVTLADGRTWQATVVGSSPDFDLAVLRIDAPAGRLAPIPLGTSEDLQVGQRVFAIGNPFGLQGTLTTGIISGLDRIIESLSGVAIHGVIQTDAAINPGNSGGPLLDSAGRLIGVNTAIKSPTGANAGVGFAVPVDTVNEIVPALMRDGHAERVGLGITVGPDAWAEDLGVEGAVVDRVFRGTGAAEAGLQGSRLDEDSVRVGDIIVGVDARPIRGQEDLFLALHGYSEGDVVDVTILREREGERRIEEISVRLREISRMR